MGFAVELFLPHSSRQTSPEELLQLDAVTLVHDFLAQSQFQVLTSSVVVLNGNDRNYPPATLYPPPIYRVPQKYRSKVHGSEGHKNGANQILILCMFFFYFGTFGLMILQLILASKLSNIEQFENISANNQLEIKQE